MTCSDVANDRIDEFPLSMVAPRAFIYEGMIGARDSISHRRVADPKQKE